MSLPLMVQTTYAELVNRCETTAFKDAFPEDGAFTPKTVKGRRYWYFQHGADKGRGQRYVGPETPKLLERIARHKNARDDERERRALVSALVRSFGMPKPLDEIGAVVAALARAGVFRLRAVLVGTVAYQTYSAMLGTRLPASVLATEDVDIAQFTNVSIAVQDEILPMLDVLRNADPSFDAIPHQHDSRRATSYQTKRGLRVDFLTPNEGADTDEPQTLPALQTDTQPLRFLDYLIHDPEPAVVLHGSGIYVHVPAPQRYAIHKLIVARRRKIGAAKSEKDLLQSQALMSVLVHKRPHDVRAAWMEAVDRGPSWKLHLVQSILLYSPAARDMLLKTVSWKRETIAGLDLRFARSAPRYDFDRDVVVFDGNDESGPMRCEISREALEDHFGAEGLDKQGRMERFGANRAVIERMARAKYRSFAVDEPGIVLIKTEDVRHLRRIVGACSA